MFRKLLYVSSMLIVLLMLLRFSSQPVNAAVNVDILPKHSGYINDVGYYCVVGEVQNTGDSPVENVQVEAKFYDSNGELMADLNGTTKLSFLLPSRKAPFEITLYSSEDSLRVHNYTLKIVSYEIPSQNRPLGLEIISNSSSKNINSFNITGQIKNVGPSNTTFIRVVATFYDELGYPIAAKIGPSNPSSLTPGGVAQFEIALVSYVAVNVTSYALEAESFDYALVPEFQTEILIAILLISTIAISLITKRYKKRKANLLHSNAKIANTNQDYFLRLKPINKSHLNFRPFLEYLVSNNRALELKSLQLKKNI